LLRDGASPWRAVYLLASPQNSPSGKAAAERVLIRKLNGSYDKRHRCPSINVTGGSSSPLLDVKTNGRRTPLFSASPDGAADPPASENLRKPQKVSSIVVRMARSTGTQWRSWTGFLVHKNSVWERQRTNRWFAPTANLIRPLAHPHLQ
jgi:hypothetical protein